MEIIKAEEKYSQRRGLSIFLVTDHPQLYFAYLYSSFLCGFTKFSSSCSYTIPHFIQYVLFINNVVP